MGTVANQNDLICKAQRGNQEALDQLAEHAEVRLHTYIYRVTLGSDLTGDIVQESILAMVKHIHALRNPEQFWPWLYRIAGNMLNRQYRQEQRQQGVFLFRNLHSAAGDKQRDAVAEAIGNELRENILLCMARLKPNHRMILTMRCYDRMAYAEIAEAMGTTEFGARRQFFRAKQALAKHLSRSGLGKGALVMALTLFGQMSSTTDAGAAGVSITASLLDPGPMASLAGLLSGKEVGCALATIGLAGGLTSAYMMSNRHISIETTQKDVSLQQPYDIPGNREICYYYPPDSGDAVLLRIQSEDQEATEYCQWFQNQQGNFYKQSDTVFVENARYWSKDLSTMRLPTDPMSLNKFLNRLESTENGFTHVRPRRNGITIFVEQKDGQYQTPVILDYDVRDEEAFRYHWSSALNVVDHRDLMHKRGWTFFRITGHIKDQSISGAGRIPFVHAAYRHHTPWIQLQVGDSLVMEDTRRGACVYSKEGAPMAAYKPKAFFRGLSRPWTGLHTIDTIRRDAAEQRLAFTTQGHPSDSDRVVVTIETGACILTYTIDMSTDVIERITFYEGEKPIGEINFEYCQEITDTDARDFSEPGTRPANRSRQTGPGLLWLTQCVDETLGK